MIARLRRWMKSGVRMLRPHMVDPWAFTMIAVAFGLGVMLMAWHGEGLKLQVEGADLAWVVLVGFGLTWHGEWGSGWRMGAGLTFGAVAAIAAFYGVMSIFPLTAFAFGLGIGIAALGVALLTHAYPRTASFAAAAVGFGVGIAASRSMPLRPTTPADDMFALMFTATLCLVLGVAGSLALRAIVLRIGQQRPSASEFVRFIPRLLQRREPVEPEGGARHAPSRPRSRTRIGAGR